MEKQPFFSIIVPVYNSAQYLHLAVDSVLKQKFTDYELILVNDGSTDESGNICELYSKKHNCIKYVSKKNGGLCSARNCGLDLASGRYIMFLDNDDEYAQDALIILYNVIQQYDVDVVRFNRKRIQIFSDGSMKTDIFGTKGVTNTTPVKFTRKEFFENYPIVIRSGCFGGIWNGVYKRTLFNTIRFDETITAGSEDAIVNREIYDIFQTVVFIPNILYIYYRRASHSTSTRFELNHVLALKKETTLERKLLQNNNISDEYYLDGFYTKLAHLIKYLDHRDSTLSLNEKCSILDNLKNDCYGFQITTKQVITSKKTGLQIKLYLLLYTMRLYRLLFFVTDVVLKTRGNL